MTPDGMTRLASPYTVRDTIDRIASAASASGMSIFARIDHASAAADVGLPMRPAELLIFGSACVATPIMQVAPTAALDLPLKALAWQDEDGATWLGFNNLVWIANRHFLDDEQDMVDTMAVGLFRVMHEAICTRDHAGTAEADLCACEPEVVMLTVPAAVRPIIEQKVPVS